MDLLAPVRSDRAAPSLLWRALAHEPDSRRCRDLPVDWWDEAAAVWRPTALVCTIASRGASPVAEVLEPDGEATSTRRVAVTDLRVSRLLTPGVAAYWVLRHRSLLLLTLLEHEDTASPSSARLDDALRGLRPNLLLAHDVWHAAFTRGAPPDHDEPGEGARRLLACDEPPSLPRSAVRRAEQLLAHDLIRFEAVLRAAGESAVRLVVHPLVAATAHALLTVCSVPVQLSATRPPSARASGDSSGSRAAHGRTVSHSESPSTSKRSPTSAASNAQTEGSVAPTPAKSGMDMSSRKGPASSRIRRTHAGAGTRWMGVPSKRPRR